MMMKKFLSLSLILSLTLSTLPLASAESIDCSKANLSEAEKNYCLVKQREIDNKGYSWDQLGRDSLETLTVMIAAMAAITVQVSSKAGTENKCPVYFGRQLEPVMVAAGGLLLIYAEINNYITFKTDCSELLSAKGGALAEQISKINEDAGPDQILSTSCTAETLKVEGQVSDYCRAKACTLRMKKSADQKIKHLDWVKTAYLSAATIELANIVVNLAKGVMCSLVYTSATVCANITASDCYTYGIDEDATVKSFLVQGPKRKSLRPDLEMHFVNTLNFNLQREKYDRALLSQINHSANYVETLLLIDDYQRLSTGAVASISVDEYHFLNSLNLNRLDKTNQLKGVVKTALELTEKLSPFQNAHAKFDTNEVLSSLGMVAGVSAMLMTSTRKAVTQVIKKAWAYPLGRVAYFGALYGLVYANQEVYKNRIVKELEKRSQSFDDKITELTMPDVNPGNLPVPTDIAITIPTIPPLPKVKTPKVSAAVNCISEDLTRDPTCECLKANKCNDMKIPEVTLPDGVHLPNSIMTNIKNMRDLSNAYSRGNSSKADMASKNLTAGFAALNSDYFKLKNKLKQDQIEAKQTPYEVDKEIKSMQGVLLKAVAHAMGVPAPAANSSNHAIGGGEIKNKDNDNKVVNDTQQSSPTATDKASPADLLSNSLNLNDESEANGLADQTDKAELKGFQFQTDEISKKPEENIFKKISSRYLRSAYPALLKEIKPVKK